MQALNFVKTAGGKANLIAAPQQLAPDIAGFVNTVRECLDQCIVSARAQPYVCIVIKQLCSSLVVESADGRASHGCKADVAHTLSPLTRTPAPEAVEDNAPQSFGIVSGAAWIGLNSVANPGTQQWAWAGGQNYDDEVQARLQSSQSRRNPWSGVDLLDIDIAAAALYSYAGIEVRLAASRRSYVRYVAPTWLSPTAPKALLTLEQPTADANAEKACTCTHRAGSFASTDFLQKVLTVLLCTYPLGSRQLCSGPCFVREPLRALF